MSFKEKISDVQKRLKAEGLDGWLLYDFRRANDLACTFLELPEETHLTRRFFYWIPVLGEPVAIVSVIETHVLAHLPGEKRPFLSWEELQNQLKTVLSGIKRVAMEYSPRNAIPYVSKVDGGTLEMVRSLGVDVVSSASFLQYYTCILNKRQLQTHLKAADVLDQTAAKTWLWLKGQLQSGAHVNEYDVQQFIKKEIEMQGCISDSPPMCNVGVNSANPHYCPTKESAAPISRGDFVQIDLWCKVKEQGSIYADISRVAIAASHPKPKHTEIFQIVRAAQKAATDFIQSRISRSEPVFGFEADRAARQVIEDAGYGKFFTHRTGHNIYQEGHGPGAHLDSLETQDQRPLLPKTCFSVEPAIYLPGEFGVRLEHDVYIEEGGKIRITGGVQDSLVLLL